MVAGVAVVSGVAAALAGTRPTGQAAVDAVLSFAVGALVAWAAATAGWRVLLAAAAVLVPASSTAWVPLLAALAAFGGAAWLANHRASVPVVRAAIGGAMAGAALRIEWNPFFLASALVAALTLGAVVVAGVVRRPRSIRRRVIWTAAAMVGFCVVAGVGLMVTTLGARNAARNGYSALLDGLDQVGSGDTQRAAESFRQAADDLRRADSKIAGALSMPARLVPVLAPNLRAGDAVLGGAADAASAAADALRVVDLDQLKVVDGVIDVGAVSILSDPLGRLESAVVGLQKVLGTVDSPWLLGPVHDRITRSRVRADKVAVQAHAAVAAARLAPDLLGASGQRRYLVAFTSPAEQRGQSGLMGNWAEVTVSKGRLQMESTGRTNELVDGLRNAPPLHLSGLDQSFFDRYRTVGAGDATTPVNPKYWSNVTMSPDMPTVGAQMAQMYERATGRAIDGVFVLDPAAVASLLRLTGPVVLPQSNVTLTSDNAEQLLLRGQYDRPEADRESFLSEATTTTIDQLLHSTLPGPQVIASQLGPVAQGGHLSAWAAVPDEETLLELVGMDASLPLLDGADGIGVSLDNGAGNKIDSFQQVSVDYVAKADEGTGAVEATATITITNTAPSSGLPDYVIGNLVGLPAGTSRTRVTVLSPLRFDAATLDGAAVGMNVGSEHEWGAFTRVVDVPAGSTVQLVMHLRGVVKPGPYRLVVRPQPTAQATDWSVRTAVAGGETIKFTGALERRSVISATGVDAYRPVPTAPR